MEALYVVATFAGGLVGGWIGSHRKLDALARHAAELAVKEHEKSCTLRHVAEVSGSWRLPTSTRAD